MSTKSPRSGPLPRGRSSSCAAGPARMRRGRGRCESWFASPGGRVSPRGLRKVEKKVDSKAALRIEEAGARRRIQFQACDRDPAVRDRRGDVARFVQTRDELEAAVVEQRDRARQALTRTRNHEIEVPRHSPPSQDDEGHASHEHGIQPEGAQRFDDFANRPEWVDGFSHSGTRGIDPRQATGEGVLAPDDRELPAAAAAAAYRRFSTRYENSRTGLQPLA